MNDAPRPTGLSPEEKRALLARLLRERVDQETVFPLSHGQKALWVLHRLAPASAAYNVAFTATLRSEVDVQRLRTSLATLVGRHEILRMTVDHRDGALVQRIAPRIDVALDEIDASPWTKDELREELSRSYRVPFDLEKGPVFRASLYHRTPTEHVLLLVVHHLAVDAWSIGLLVSEWMTTYAAERGGVSAHLAPLSARYADFVRWQEELLGGAGGAEMLSYWRGQLRSPLPSLQVPTDRARPPFPSFRGGTHGFRIDEATAGALRDLARSEGTTLFSVLLAAFDVLLFRYSGQDDILVGSPTAGRSRQDFEGLVGYFVNPVVLRADLSGDPTFVELVGRTRASVIGALRNADYPFPLVVQHLNPDRDPSRSPLFQAEFNLVKLQQLGVGQEAVSPGAVSSGTLGGLWMETFALPQQEGQFDLSFEVVDLGGSLLASLKYSTDLFETSTIERMKGHLQTLLRGIVAEPTARLSALPLLTEGERQTLASWNATGEDIAEGCVHELIRERAATIPERVAVRSAEGHLTFGDLEQRAERLASLLRDRGVRPGVLVGVYMERRPDMLVALLGVWKAGGAYVPLDPGFPPERLSYMVEDSGAALLLTQAGLEGSLPTRAVPAITVDEVVRESWAGGVKVPDAALPLADDLAYVIYTSGSTGRPKGVAVTHRALLNLLLSMQREPGLAESDTLLSVTTLSFDIAALELYLPLLVGARVYVASREDVVDGRRLVELLDESGATVMQATPATWRMLLDSGWKGTPGLKVLCGGEALPRDLAEELLKRAGEVWNVYGPTETTVWSSVQHVESGEGPVAIGRPIANTEMWVLDERLVAVPVGIAGELYIGGSGVARGYWRRPELTAEKFVPDPFSRDMGRRLYRTGDLARCLAGGRLECLGRIDNQVKLRGFRIELGEIEAALRECPGVDEAVVLALEGADGDRGLVAYVVRGEGEATEVATLREQMKRSLPSYMLPSSFVFLGSLPLTPNGKVDRRALPKLSGEAEAQRTEFVAPRTATERTVAEIWGRTLSLSTPPGVDDNFFDLGGHSFSAARMMATLQSTFGVDVALRNLFERPTIAGLAEVVDLLLLSRPLRDTVTAETEREEFEF